MGGKIPGGLEFAPMNTLLQLSLLCRFAHALKVEKQTIYGFAISHILRMKGST